MIPEVGCTSPMMQFSSVDFPHPLGPTMVRNSPSSMSRLKSSTASTRFPREKNSFCRVLDRKNWRHDTSLSTAGGGAESGLSPAVIQSQKLSLTSCRARYSSVTRVLLGNAFLSLPAAMSRFCVMSTARWVTFPSQRDGLLDCSDAGAQQPLVGLGEVKLDFLANLLGGVLGDPVVGLEKRPDHLADSLGVFSSRNRAAQAEPPS